MRSGELQRVRQLTQVSAEERARIGTYALSYRPVDLAEHLGHSRQLVDSWKHRNASQEFLETLPPLDGDWPLPENLLHYEIDHFASLDFSVYWIADKLKVKPYTVAYRMHKTGYDIDLWEYESGHAA